MTGAALLDGRVAVVTGGARGIGAAVTEVLARAGARVVVADRDRASAEEQAGRLRAAGAQAHVSVVDVADEDSVEAAADDAVAAFGRLDVVVANAGIVHLDPVDRLALADWSRVIAVNLTGAFLTVRAFGRRLVEQGEGGSVVVSSSLFGRRGGRENAAYSASKFGVIGLVESAAADLAPAGVRVNAVCPGQVDTEMIRELADQRAALTGTAPGAVLDAMAASIPLGRLAGVDEVADTYLYLASPLSRYVTGQSLVVDGGLQVG